MKNTIKKTTLFLLATAFCFAALVFLFGMEAKADNAYIHSGDGWGITADGKLIVNIQTGNFPKMGRIPGDVFPQWYEYRDEIKTAEVSMGSPTSLSYMFYYCENLTSVSFSGFNTSNVTGMNNMFEGCKSLTSLDLSGFDTSKVNNMSRMFSNCSSFTSLDLSNFDTSKVKNMSFMFNGCSSLTSPNLSNFNVSNVTSMKGMFKACSLFTSLELSNFDTSKVEDMSEMFQMCSSLTSLNLNSFDTSNCTNMAWMFRECYALSSITFGDKFDTSKVTSMKYMFTSSRNLQTFSVKIPFDTRSVTDMLDIFAGCTKLSNSALDSIGFKDFDTSKVKLFGSIFYGCENLSIIDLSNWDFSQATTQIKIESTFDHELTVHTIIMPANMPTEVMLPISFKNTLNWYSTYDPSAVYTETCANKDTAITYISILTPKLDKTTLTLTGTNRTEKLTTTVSPLNITNTHVIYESSDPAVATVDENGNVTAVSSGSCEIKVTVDAINKASDTCSVTVNLHMHKWSADWDKDSIGHWHNCTVTSSACTITDNEQKDGYSAHEYDDEADMVCNVCGYCRMDSISLNKNSVNLTGIGDTATLTATAQPLGVTLSSVTYNSSDESIATVDENGKVTAVSNGSCTITVTSNEVPSCSATCNIVVHVHNWSADWEIDGTHHWHNCTVTSPACNITTTALKDGYSAHTYDNETGKICNTCGYVRKINVTGVSLDKHSIKLIDKDSTAVIKATVTPSDADVLTVSYKSSDPSVATVDKNGEIKAVGNGTCTITATSADNAEAYDTCTVTVHVHKWSSKWQNNNTHHWHICENSGCDITADSEKYAYGEHFYDDVLDKTCNDCGYVRKIVIKDEKGSSGNALANRTDMPVLLVTGSCYKKKHVKLKWTKYASASGYEVYWSYCDGRQNYKLLGSVKKPKYIHKNLKKTREYKYFVIAYKKVGKKKVYLCKSPSIHVAMSYDKRTNVKKIKTNITNLTLEKNKTFQIKATLTKQKKSKKLIEHVSKIRYYTTNKKVAAVSKTGKITAMNVGQCTIYVAANSGLTKKIVVKVL